MLDKILETNQFVSKNAKHVTINYEKANEFKEELLNFKNIHYLRKVPYDIYNMTTEDLVNFLLIYDSIDFSFWGDPKWSITLIDRELDGGIALLDCIYNLFNGSDSKEVYQYLEKITLEDFSLILKGNIDIPLLEKRYNIVKNIVRLVNEKMNGNFYDYIKGINNDKELFQIIIDNFPNFKDVRNYNDKTIYFYKLAQLLTSDILHVIEIKENKKVDYSNLIGCADYKIPQVMQGLGILEYDKYLASLLEEKIEIEENSEYEVEIRASMIVAINYIWEQVDKCIAKIDINDYIWNKGQDKTKHFKPYHRTRTTTY